MAADVEAVPELPNPAGQFAKVSRLGGSERSGDERMARMIHSRVRKLYRCSDFQSSWYQAKVSPVEARGASSESARKLGPDSLGWRSPAPWRPCNSASPSLLSWENTDPMNLSSICQEEFPRRSEAQDLNKVPVSSFVQPIPCSSNPHTFKPSGHQVRPLYYVHSTCEQRGLSLRASSATSSIQVPVRVQQIVVSPCRGFGLASKA